MTIKKIDKANTIHKYADILKLASYKPKKKKVLTIKNNENTINARDNKKNFFFKI